MANLLGDYIQSEREKLRLRRSDVAKLLGYSNVNKGCRRVMELERGCASKALLAKVLEILGLDPAQVQQLAAEDSREFDEAWNRWADEPVPLAAAVRLAPGTIAQVPLPNEVQSPEDAVAATSCG